MVLVVTNLAFLLIIALHRCLLFFLNKECTCLLHLILLKFGEEIIISSSCCVTECQSQTTIFGIQLKVHCLSLETLTWHF